MSYLNFKRSNQLKASLEKLHFVIVYIFRRKSSDNKNREHNVKTQNEMKHKRRSFASIGARI